MFLFLFLPVLLIVAMLLIVGPAVLPFAVVAALVFWIYHMVIRHHGAGHDAQAH
jgi:hypothetical protein